MSDRNVHRSLTLRDREGQVVVYEPSSINAGHDVADSDSGSVVRRNAANRERSSSPEVVQISNTAVGNKSYKTAECPLPLPCLALFI